VDELSCFLERFDLGFMHPFHNNQRFIFYLKNGGDEVYNISIEPQHSFHFERPNYHLRLTKERVGFFPNAEAREKFFFEVFPFLKKYIDENIPYQYLFVHHQFLESPIPLEERFFHFLTYGHEHYSSFPSPLGTDEVDGYLIIWKSILDFFKEEKKSDSRFDFYVSNAKRIAFYRPDTKMELSMNHHDRTTEVRIDRANAAPKVLKLVYSQDEVFVRSVIKNFFYKMFGENRLRAVFEPKKPPIYHQVKILLKVKTVNFNLIFKELSRFYNEEELEKAAAVEFEKKDKNQFVFKSDVFDEPYYLASFEKHCFIFKGNENTFIEHFTFSEIKEAVEHFHAFLQKQFTIRLNEQKKQLENFFKI